MMKKLLSFLTLLFLSIPLIGQNITIQTTSVSGNWSPVEVLKTGDPLTWTASNAVIGTVSPTSQSGSDPVFDFSGNDGTPIDITVSSTDGFGGLERLNLSDDEGIGAGIVDLNVDVAVNLERLDVRFNDLTAIDVSSNTALQRLFVRNNVNLSSLDVSTNVQLSRLHLNRTNISTLDISNNPLLNNVRVNRCQFETADLDNLVIQLDAFGLSNGFLQLSNNPGILSNASLNAYNNLIARGWTIDVSAPPSPSVETITLTTTSTSAAWSPFSVVNQGATLKWEVSGGVTIPEVEVDDPTLDLSGNAGVATITITSDFGFAGLTELDFWNDNGVGSEIQSIDVTNAQDLERLNVRINEISALDVSQNPLLTRLIIRNNALLTGTLDISNNTALQRIVANSTSLDNIDLSNNTSLLIVRLNNAQFPSAVLDQILIDLDNHGLSGGDLRVSGNAGGLTAASLTAYNNLIGKGWTIDVDPPQGSQTMTLTTTSTSAAWSPFEVLNSGATLEWEATNGLIGTLNQTADDPTFDFSANDGSPISITVTSSDGFTGLTRLDLWNDNNLGSDITDLDVSNADNLERLNVRFNELTTLDVSQNTQLDRLNVRGNANLAGTLDISTNTILDQIQINGTIIDNIDVSNNPLLDDVRLYSAQLPSAVLDQVLIDLDGHGLSNGNLEIRNNAGDLTIASLTAYNNLIGRGWTIDVGPPQGLETMTITTTSTSSAWSPFEVLNGGATLEWEATNGLIGTLVQNVDDPTFDFSANDGSPISITVSSSDGFTGLTRLDLWNDNNLGSDITDLDVSNADNLERLNVRFNELTTLDVSQNTLLDRLTVRGNANLAGTLDISNNTILDRVQIDGTIIDNIDVSTNPLLLDVRLYNAQLPSAVLDQVLIDLDGHGLSNGNLEIRNNAGVLTTASLTAYNNLIAKGWTIDVGPPQGLETMTITTTSTSSAWSPFEVLNGGATLEWEATNGLIGTLVQNVDDPTFDFSANDGSPISITVSSSDGFTGLTRLDLWNDNNLGSDITDLDVSNADNLERLNVRFNDLTMLDVSQNTLLDRLIVRGNANLAGTLDISANTVLDRVQIDGTIIDNIDVSTNPLLLDVRLYNAQLPSAVLDQVLIDLDGHGLSNGNLEIRNNAGELTFNSFTAYNNLIAKGWTIDVGPPLAPGAQINLQGNGLDIVSNNAAIPEDGTDFGETTIGSPIVNTFEVQNIGSEDLVITLFLGTSPDFTTTGPTNLTIAPGGSESFDVTFNPSTLGSKTGSVIIQSNDADTSIFVLVFAGESVEVLSNQIMISQYYHGFSGSDNWVEVSNISGGTLPAGTYFLNLFDEGVARDGLIQTSAPTASIAIPELGVGETILFKNAAATVPSAGNIGPATVLETNVCDFDGDDVLLIATANDNTAYNLRVDIMGNISPGPGISPEPWGTNDSYIKGGCSSEEAHKEFDIADWTFVLINDVNNADPNRNVALGTQVVGPTFFDGSTWSNLEPDQSRTAVISGSFTGAPDNFIACNLTIESGVDAVFDSGGATSNSIVIYGDLIVDGNLTIGDKESLVVYNPSASLGVITKNEVSNVHNFPNDATYWSSPVQGAQLGTVFAGSDPERTFEFRAGEVNPKYAGTNYKYWWMASGAMARAKGYAVEGVGTGAQSISFTGIPYNGPFQLNLFYSGTPDVGPTANENFNLIGNPYPAAIDMQRILTDNGTVNEIALWTHSTEVDPGTGEFFDADYVYYSTTGSTTPGVTENIASGQGFMIRTVDFGGTNFIDDYKLIGQNDQFFKGIDSKTKSDDSVVEDKLWLRMNLGREKSDILIGFVEGATDGYDMYHDVTGNLYDSGISLIEKNIKFYSKIDSDKFVIQGMGSFNGSRKVSLGFDTEKAGDFRISLTKTQGELDAAHVYLVDHALNIRHDLKRSDYIFYQTDLGEFTDRFTLELNDSDTVLDVDELVDEALFSISNDFDVMNVNSGKMVRDIKVYDMLGRMVIHKTPNLKSFQLNTSSLRTGTVMIIEARLEDGTLMNTKSIKY